MGDCYIHEKYFTRLGIITFFFFTTCLAEACIIWAQHEHLIKLGQ